MKPQFHPRKRSTSVRSGDVEAGASAEALAVLKNQATTKEQPQADDYTPLKPISQLSRSSTEIIFQQIKANGGGGVSFVGDWDPNAQNYFFMIEDYVERQGHLEMGDAAATKEITLQPSILSRGPLPSASHLSINAQRALGPGPEINNPIQELQVTPRPSRDEISDPSQEDVTQVSRPPGQYEELSKPQRYEDEVVITHGTHQSGTSSPSGKLLRPMSEGLYALDTQNSNSQPSDNLYSTPESALEASEDETDYSEDEFGNSLSGSQSPSSTHTIRAMDVVVPVLSPIREDIVARVMQAFWEKFHLETRSSSCNDDDSGHSSSPSPLPTINPLAPLPRVVETGQKLRKRIRPSMGDNVLAAFMDGGTNPTVTHNVKSQHIQSGLELVHASRLERLSGGQSPEVLEKRLSDFVSKLQNYQQQNREEAGNRQCPGPRDRPGLGDQDSMLQRPLSRSSLDGQRITLPSLQLRDDPQRGQSNMTISPNEQNIEKQTSTRSPGTRYDNQTSGTSTSSSLPSQHAPQETPSASRRKGKEKRRNNDDDDEGRRGDDRDRDAKRPRTLLSPPIVHDNKRKFACPYRKHNPGKYRSSNKQWRSCALTPLDNVARVKGHLYRHHMIYPCQRCKRLFKNEEEVGRHLTEPQGCELQDIGFGDGITNKIVEQLKTKKKAHRDDTEEDRWRSIYVLLFPSHNIPSPHFEQPDDSTELEDYEQYCRRELPRVVRATVREIVGRETQPIEDRLINQLESIIQNAQQQVYASYRFGSISPIDNQVTPEGTISSVLLPHKSTQFPTSLSANLDPSASNEAIDSEPRSHLQENNISAHSPSRMEPVSSDYPAVQSPPLPATNEIPAFESAHGSSTPLVPLSPGTTHRITSSQDPRLSHSSSSNDSQEWTIVSRPETFEAIFSSEWPDIGQQTFDDYDWGCFMDPNTSKAPDEVL